ncbi:hypothetical protein [Streptomyces lonegramiae]|uniref:Uncharacterized protein n=1 Tax=Streptomyces lonegramiae TaxID=3075524 RepID=A0ABU2XAR6_9ACTN|nr:hypothetical protein [Streptomyces sp. DSM 41529]MDT0542561.1 hypothetical protein [Streptomyces sp. DSM 41529]
MTTEASYISSTIPDFDGTKLGIVWDVVGEPHYADTLAKLGEQGVPMPIMEDFSFVFDDADLSIQKNYISVLANVSYK